MQKSILFLASLILSINASAIDIEVRGKVMSPCTINSGIKIRDYNVMGSEFKEVTLNAKHEFTYHFNITEPKQLSVKAGAMHIDFLATANEKVYNIEIYCGTTHGDTMIIKNSKENNAFAQLYYVNKSLQDKLRNLANGNISAPENFAQVKKLFHDYQTKITAIAAASPASYTATVFIPSEKLPEENFASIEALRKNYFKRAILSNPVYYNTFLSSRIVLGYMSIRDKTDKANKWIDDAMAMAAKNTETTKRLQQVFYDLFYARKEEALLAAYSQWASTNPQSMMNPVVKAQLQNLENIMTGSPFTDITLKDPKGISHQLSTDVASAKLTLLIFYSPTCSHCQEQLPKLVPVWNKYKNKGLKIYATGYDGTTAEWNAFIKKYITPEWTNVWEGIDMPNRPTIKYVVNVTPALILIDQQGKIIERFDEFDEVVKLISKRLD